MPKFSRIPDKLTNTIVWVTGQVHKIEFVVLGPTGLLLIWTVPFTFHNLVPKLSFFTSEMD